MLRCVIFNRCDNYYQLVRRTNITSILKEVEYDDEHKRNRNFRQGVSIILRRVFVVNEWELEWFPTGKNKDRYISLLCDAVALDVKHMLQDEYDSTIQNSVNLKFVRDKMGFDLPESGPREPNIALEWWKMVDNSTGNALLKLKMLYDPMFILSVRAYLSIQESSAAATSLFGDSGF